MKNFKITKVVVQAWCAMTCGVCDMWPPSGLYEYYVTPCSTKPNEIVDVADQIIKLDLQRSFSGKLNLKAKIAIEAINVLSIEQQQTNNKVQNLQFTCQYRHIVQLKVLISGKAVQ